MFSYFSKVTSTELKLQRLETFLFHEERRQKGLDDSLFGFDKTRAEISYQLADFIHRLRMSLYQ